MTSQLSDLLDFVSLTHDIRAVKRSMWVRDDEQFENDSEHSYQLAMTALYIIESEKLDLDAFRAMGLALVHDILEVHAGDTPAFAEQEVTSSQTSREKDAIAQLKQDWPQLPIMLSLIDEYESCDTKESKFIYALDKLLPITNNYLDDGRNWKRNKVSLEQIIQIKADKVSADTLIESYYIELIGILREHPELFGGQ